MQALPTASIIQDLPTRQVVEPIRNALTILGRNKGRIEESALLVQDMVDIGLIRVVNQKIIFDPNAPAAPAFSDQQISTVRSSYDDDLVVEITGTGNTRTISLSVTTGGSFIVRIWLTDAADPASSTLQPPTGGDKVDWKIVTATDGSYSETIQNSTVKEWYVQAAIVGKINANNLMQFT